MTEELLRRWVRDELPPDERRKVTRWMVCCTSPDLGPLLQGMVQELRDERADRALTARGGAWSRLVDAWHGLLDAGRAALFDADGALSLASLAEDEPAPREVEIGAHRGGPALWVRVEAREVAAYLTDDQGTVQRLLLPGETESVAWPVALPQAGERPTVWAVWGERLPRHGDALTELDAALSDPSVGHAAARWVREAPDA